MAGKQKARMVVGKIIIIKNSTHPQPQYHICFHAHRSWLQGVERYFPVSVGIQILHLRKLTWQTEFKPIFML